MMIRFIPLRPRAELSLELTHKPVHYIYILDLLYLLTINVKIDPVTFADEV